MQRRRYKPLRQQPVGRLGRGRHRERGAAAGGRRKDASGVFPGLHSGRSSAKMPFEIPRLWQTMRRLVLPPHAQFHGANSSETRIGAFGDSYAARSRS